MFSALRIDSCVTKMTPASALRITYGTMSIQRFLLLAAYVAPAIVKGVTVNMIDQKMQGGAQSPLAAF
jgi:hypothetical protein